MHKLHKVHARMPKHFVLEERLARYADAIETEPRKYAGRWAEACHPLDESGLGRFSKVELDLGCGKGAFACGMAKMRPDTLYIGIDTEPVCIAYAAQLALEEKLPNALFVPGMGNDVPEFFGEGELSCIHINFPTPFPKKRFAEYRLTILDRLMDYRRVLAPGAPIVLKTDSQPFFDFTLTQLPLANYRLVWKTDDTRSKLPDEPVTGYEERLTAQGAKVLGLCAIPEDPAPTNPMQTAELSLSRYLPHDLENMDYVPYGMENTVRNMKDYKKKHGEGYYVHNR